MYFYCGRSPDLADCPANKRWRWVTNDTFLKAGKAVVATRTWLITHDDWLFAGQSKSELKLEARVHVEEFLWSENQDGKSFRRWNLFLAKLSLTNQEKEVSSERVWISYSRQKEFRTLSWLVWQLMSAFIPPCVMPTIWGTNASCSQIAVERQIQKITMLPFRWSKSKEVSLVPSPLLRSSSLPYPQFSEAGRIGGLKRKLSEP